MEFPFEGQSPFDKLVGIRVKEASPDRVVAVLPVTESLHQNHGILHGGVYSTIIETVASVGAFLWLEGDGVPVGISNHTQFLRSVRSGELQAEATPLTRGRSTQLWQVGVTDEAGRLVAHGQVRLMNLRS